MANPAVNASNLIAVHASKEELSVLGRIVWWSLEGDVSRDRLVTALSTVGSPAIPPEEPSAVVAVHRAVETVARANRKQARQIKRGRWAVCDKAAKIDGDVALNGATLTVGVQAIAEVRVDGAATDKSLSVDGADEYKAQVFAAYAAARVALAPTDIGGWLCDKLEALGAVPLRDRGGVYFLPAEAVHKFEKLVAALKTCSSHTVHVVPTMRSADACDAILAAVEADTLKACEEIGDEVREGKLGKRGLETREKRAAELMTRAAKYEALLGKRLDTLRLAVGEVEGAVATARLMLAHEEG